MVPILRGECAERSDRGLRHGVVIVCAKLGLCDATHIDGNTRARCNLTRPSQPGTSTLTANLGSCPG